MIFKCIPFKYSTLCRNYNRYYDVHIYECTFTLLYNENLKYLDRYIFNKFAVKVCQAST